MVKKIPLLLIILLLAAVFRLVGIDRIPHSVNKDELHYLLSAKSFFLTGKDITQTVSPLDILLFHYPPNELVQAELPYFMEMLTVGAVPFSLVGNALPNALLSILIVVLIYLVTKELTRDETISLLSGLMTAVNPWFIFMGRTSYEVIPATCFFLGACYVLLKAKRWWVLLSLPLLLLAFYSYIAIKLILLPLTIAFVLYSYLFIHKRKYTKQYVTLLIFAFIVVFFFLFQISHAPHSSRISEVMTPNSSAIGQQVDALRKTSLHTPAGSLFENKITVFIKVLFANIFNIFSPNYLFLEGDYFFSLAQYGLFYPLDALLLIIGSVWLYLHKKPLFLFLLSIIVIAILPQILHDQFGGGNFTPHIALAIPFFIIYMGIGLKELFSYLRTKKLQYVGIIFCLLYIFSIGSVMHTYFFRMPLLHDFFNFPDRVAARYIALAKPNAQKVIIYSRDSQTKFEEYIFYNNLYTNLTAPIIASALKQSNYTLDGVTFLPCDSKTKAIAEGDLVLTHVECDMHFSKQFVPVILPQLSDSGGVYNIYNDSICSSYALNKYIANFRMEDFAVNKLSMEQFCKTFMTSL